MPEAERSISRHRPPGLEPVSSVALGFEGSLLIALRPELDQGQEVWQFCQRLRFVPFGFGKFPGSVLFIQP